MRTAHRNRRRYSVALIGFALILLCVGGVSALSADYTVAENGTSYIADVEVLQAENYTEERSAIRFPEGNYTIRYIAPLSSNELTVMLDDASNISVFLPGQYAVANPLLGYVSTGGTVNATENGTTILWENARSAQVRYYDAFQEQALIIFGTFWIGIVVIFLVPYLIVRRKRE